MMKTRITRISKRTLAMILGVLMLVTSVGLGSLISAGAASSTITVYFQDNYGWGTVYAFSGSNMNVRNNGGYGYDVYGGSLNTGWVTMTKVAGTTNIFTATMTVYDGKVAFAKAKSNQAGYFNNCNQCAVTPSGMTNGKLLNIWTGSGDEVSNMNSTSYRKYDLQNYTPPVPYITGINGDWSTGDVMTLDSGSNYYYAFTGDGSTKYFRFKFGTTYYEAYSDGFDLENDGTYKPYDGSTDNKKYGARSGNNNAFKLSANVGYDYRIYFDASGNKCWFTKTAKIYTITYNKGTASGASGSVSSTSKTHGVNATLSSSTFSRTGYTQDGWSVNSNGSTKDYTLGYSSYSTEGDATLYPHWTANTYTVTLNKNSGSGGTDSVTATYGSAMPSATMPTRDGYNFAGYYDTSNASGGTQYYTAAGASARSWNKTSATTLYARWTLKTYTVTYKPGSNSSGSDYTATKNHGSALTLRGSTYTRTGYTQTGWNTDSSGSGGTHYALSGSYTDNAAVTLYPEWTLNSYTITLSETNASGGVLKVDDTVASTATHGSHTFRVDAPSGYEISSISGLGATWTNHESYAESNSVSITGAGTITVTYVASTKPALRIDYTGSGGTTFTATNGDSVTTSTRHNVTVTFTNQSAFPNGTSYTVTQKIGSNAATTIKSGTTSTSGGNIVAKAAGTLSAGTYVYTISANNKTTSITVVVNQSRTLTVNSVTHTTVSGSYTNEFGQTSQSISAAGTFYCKSGTSYSVTYTAASDYCFSDSDNSVTTNTDSGTISANYTATAPTVYEKKFTLTKTTYKTNADNTNSSSNSTASMNTVTGTDVGSGTVAGYYVTSWQVTSGTVIVNGTSYTSSSGAQSIAANSTSYTLTSVTLKGAATVRFNFTERSYTLTKKKKLGDAAVENIGTQACYRVTKSTVTAPAITGYKVSSWQITTSNNYFYVGSTVYNSSSGVQDITDVDTYTISNVTLRGAATIQFNYTENTYTVTVNAQMEGTKHLGNITAPSGGSGSTVTAGVDTNPTITAVAKDGYEFVNWTKTAGTVSFGNANNTSTTVSASATSTVQANFRRTRVYLDVGSVWAIGTNNVDHFAAYFYNYGTNNGSTSWVTMTAVPGVANRYYADIPEAARGSSYKIIFVSLNNATNNWNNKVAQTVDITTDYQKNLYTLSSTLSDNKNTGSWESDAYFPPTTYSVIVNAAEHGTVDGTTTETIQVPDEGTAITLPTPQAAYGYKFTGWELISGSIKYNNTTYSTANTVFSTTASTAITANAASTVRANFDYDNSMNLYIVGRFRVYNTYTGSPRTPTYVGGSSGAWSLTATNIPFQYNADNHYYYVDTNSSIAELSATLSDKQYFRVYDQSNSKNWQLTANQALTEANEGTQYAMALSGDKSFYFNETSNANGPVKICFDPITNKLWYTIPARHTVSVGTITRKVRTTTTQDTNGGTVTVNNGSSATVSEGTNYAIKVTPVAGYKVTALAVNGSDILAGSGYANYTSEFTINHAMGSSNETITATFEAIQYTVTVGSNSSNSENTVKFKVNNGSAVTSASNVTVADTITPVVTVNSAAGYNIGNIKLQEKTGTSSYTDKVQLANNSATQMQAYNARIYVTYNAITPTFASAISATTGNSPENISISSYTISALYAGQSVTITPSVTSAGTITYSANSQSWTGTASTDNGATLTNNNNGTFTFTSSRNIGASRDTEKTYTFKIRATNTPESGFTPKNTDQQVTIKVVYSEVQKAYIDLKTQYDLYNGYNITADDVTSGYDLFEDQMTLAESKLTGIPAWDATDIYTSRKNLLISAYNALIFKTTTVYVLTNYAHNSTNWVNVFVFNDDTTNHYPTKIFESDTTLLSTCINNNKWNYHMTYEGKTNGNKYLYSFTFRGHQELIVYWQNNSTNVFDSNKKLTGNLDLRSSAYGEYYVDVKGVSYSASASTTTKSSFTDFSISAAGASGSNDLVDQYTSGAGYTVSDIQTKLGITFNGSLASASSQTVNQTYTITTPSGSTVYADSTHNWKPTQAGRYTFSLTASLGTDNRNNAGATFSGICSTIDNTSNVLALYVAYDEITIYADMNGNVGTPTIHFTYTDTNTNEDADLPLEFDMVTGSESVYSRSVKLSTLREQYGLNLIANNGLTIEKVSIDNVEVPHSTFTITPDVARTGTLWLKADSTHMKTFNEIAYGSSRRTFKAVLREDGEDDVDYNNTFADVRGTGIITDELNGDSYEYNVFYAAKDTIADYNFSYTLRAKADTDITHKDGNNTNYYYFDHWERINGSTTTTTGLTEANGADINILTAPNYDTDADVTYVAVYKLTSTQKRVEITYKFKDYNTDDGNYVFDETLNEQGDDYLNVKNASYTKTVNWNGTTALATVAQNNMPIIKSNYFDYTFDAETANVTTTKAEDNNTKKTCIEATLKHTPHKYKIVYNNTVYKGYYQQTVDQAYYPANAAQLTAAADKNWYILGPNNTHVIIGQGSTYNARFGMYQDSEAITEDGISYKFDCYTIYTETKSGTAYSSIAPAHQETYYDQDTPKARHNFYIIDAMGSTSGEFVGGGVVYATAEDGGWRQQSASDNLDTTAHIQSYINGILGTTYDQEYKAQTINNIGFRYLPYEKGQDVFRYSESMNSYIYTFAGTNTNSDSLDGQTLRVFSFFVYRNGNTYTTVVSNTYAECNRYIPAS